MITQDWFPLGWTSLISLLSKGLSKSLQHHNGKSSVLWCSVFFMVQLSHPCMTTGKNISLTIWTFVGKMVSLLFNTLSRFVIAFLPRSKYLLISWLQSPSILILEPKKIKSLTLFIVSPTIFHKAMQPDIVMLVFWMLSFSLRFFTLLFHPHQEALYFLFAFCC